MVDVQVKENFKPPSYLSNVRYLLAKQKIEDLFLKYISLPQTNELIESLIKQIKDKTFVLENQPASLFNQQKHSLGSSMTNSTMLNSQLNRSPSKSSSTPQKSPEKQGKKAQLEEDEDKAKQNRENDKIKKNQSIMSQSMHYSIIPQFYFPQGKPIDSSSEQEILNQINDIFGSNDLQVKDFTPVCSNILLIPEYLNEVLFDKIDVSKSGTLSKQTFINYWKQNLSSKSPKERTFFILKKPDVNYIVRDDFKPFMKTILQSHPGLEFLKSTPEFQDRYADTVVHRIYYQVNRKDDGKMTWKDFKNSNLYDVMIKLEKEEDINKIREYFSYEHFYVLYCKFWELDQDHDFLINKDEFSRYSGHGLSKKVVDIIFNQIPRKFKSGVPDKMNYEDFIWFIISEEDKTTLRSLEYWFKVMDLDQNGIITGYEMEYFYEEIRQRMEYLNHEIVYFQDIICQMVDLLHPEDDIKFYFYHFKQFPTQSGIFFNLLTNLNKLVAYEQRDPFIQKNEITEHPEFSDWDRFAQGEYIRLAMEEENQEQGEIEPWDTDNDKVDNTQNGPSEMGNVAK